MACQAHEKMFQIPTNLAVYGIALQQIPNQTINFDILKNVITYLQNSIQAYATGDRIIRLQSSLKVQVAHADVANFENNYRDRQFTKQHCDTEIL